MSQVRTLEEVHRIIADYDRQHLECPVDKRRHEKREAERERQPGADHGRNTPISGFN